MEKVVYIHPRGLYRVVEEVVNGTTLKKTIMMNNKDRREWLETHGGKHESKGFALPADKSTKKIYREQRHDQNIARLMNCKHIDKADHGDHEVYNPHYKRLPNISAVKVAAYMTEPGAYIIREQSKRTLYRNGQPFGCFDNRTFRKIEKDIQRVGNPGKIEKWIYKSRPVMEKLEDILRPDDGTRPFDLTITRNPDVLVKLEKVATPASPLEIKKATLTAIVAWRKAHADNCKEVRKVIGHFCGECDVLPHDKTEYYTEFNDLTKDEYEELKALYWTYPGATMMVARENAIANNKGEHLWNGTFYIDL